MRRLVILVIVMAVAYAGYWVVGSRSVNGAAHDALTGLTEAGWQVEYTDLTTRGFPSRFDTTVTDFALTSPEGLQYQAPFLQAFALSYRPNRVIIAFPPDQTVAIGGLPLTLASDGMRASGSVRANTALSFSAATLVADSLAMSTDAAGIRMRGVLAAARSVGDNNYDLYAGAKTLTLPTAVWQKMFPQNKLPAAIDAVSVDATVSLDAPIDRLNPNPGIVAITLKQAALGWGDVSIRASGSLTPDQAGFAAGQITIEAVNADILLIGLANAGLIDPGVAPTLQNMVSTMADETGKMTVPLTFANGQVSWGFLPLGPAPALP